MVAASPAPEQVETCPSHQEMIEQLAAEVETGTLYAAIKRGSTRSRRVVRRQLRKSRRIQKQRMRDYLNDPGVQTAF